MFESHRMLQKVGSIPARWLRSGEKRGRFDSYKALVSKITNYGAAAVPRVGEVRFLKEFLFDSGFNGSNSYLRAPNLFNNLLSKGYIF